jgi:hypothetical protein
MGILDNLGSLASQFASGNVSDGQVHEAFDQAAKAAPQSTLAQGLSQAFQSNQTPPFEQMVSGLFNQSNPDQKAGLLNQLLGSLGSGGLTQALSSAGLGGLAGSLSGGSVTPQQASQVPPQAVEVLAQQAARKDPSVVDKAAGFYAQHPTLVKAIGAGALALLLSHMSRR